MGRIYRPTPKQITAWVTKNFSECKPRKGGDELTINNPFDGDTGRNFNISVLKGTCHDWRGDTWTDINPRTGKRNCSFLNFVKLFLNCTYHEAAKAVSLASGSDVPSLAASDLLTDSEARSEPTEKPLVALPPGCRRLDMDASDIMTTVVTNWLRSRGVSRDIAKLYDIHFSGADVIWPYYEYGQLVYWQQRSAIDKTFRFPDEKRYGVGKGQFLYNIDNVEPASYIIVVEAIFGCMTLGAQVCATGGADMVRTQARKIRMLGPRDGVILAPDNDAAGVESIIKNGDMLEHMGMSVYFSVPPKVAYKDHDGTQKHTKDWNEFEHKLKWSKKEVRLLFESRVAQLNVMTKVKLRSIVAALKSKSVAALPGLRVPPKVS